MKKKSKTPPHEGLPVGGPPLTLESQMARLHSAAVALLATEPKRKVASDLRYVLWLIPAVRDSVPGDQRDLWILELGGTAERLSFTTYQAGLDASGGRTKAENASAVVSEENAVLFDVVANKQHEGKRGMQLWRAVTRDPRLVDLKPASWRRRYDRLRKK